jgi:hypothetical protein
MAWAIEAITFFSRLKMSWGSLQAWVASLTPTVEVITLCVTIYTVGRWAIKYKRRWPTRHLRKVWGLKNGEHVIVVCSELEHPEELQRAGEEREFIYHRKYGDLDAYFEVIITLLRLFPRIRLSVFSSGETEHTRIDMAEHIIVVGGPDYNVVTEQFLDKGITHYAYRSPDGEPSLINPKEIVLYCAQGEHEYCETTDERDYGYFERIRNPNNPTRNVILLGGCHTLGVSAAVKAYSVAPTEQGDIRTIVLKNARNTAKKISRRSEFAVLVRAERAAQTITVPIVRRRDIVVRNLGCFKRIKLATINTFKHILSYF